MKLEVHILTSQYNWILPWTLRHYCSFAQRVVVHDGGPDFSEHSGNRKICGYYGAEWQVWDTAGELNDDLARRLKNTCWHGTDADWVICADDDELIWFPEMVRHGRREFAWHTEAASRVLQGYTQQGAAMIRPYGFEMFSEKLPDYEDAYQIWNQIRDGAPDEEWYSKPILFSPKLVADSGFGVGAHEARVVLKDGRAFNVDQRWDKPNPPVYLLHYHQIGPESFVAERYDATYKRFCRMNLDRGWGNSTPGAIHVKQKRDRILPNLRRVVA